MVMRADYPQSEATTERIALQHAATTDLKHEYYPLTSVSNSSTSTSTVTHLLRPRGQYTAGVGDRLGIEMLSRNDTNGRSTRPFLSQSEPTRESVTFLQNTRARSQSRVAVAAASSARREAKTKTYDVDGGDGLRSSVNQARIAPSAEPRRVAKVSPVVTAQWDGCGREDPRPRWMSAALRTSNDEHNSREVQRRNNITGPMFGGCVTAELDGMAEDSLRLSIGDDSFVTASPTAWRGDASMTTSDISAAAADERRRTCSMQESAVTQTDGGHPEGIPRSRSLDTGCTTPQAMWGADEEQGRSSDATTPRLSGRAYGFRGDDGISFLPMLASGGGNGLVHGRSSNEDRSALRCPSFVVGSNNGASDRRVTSFTSPNVSSLSSSTDQAPSASTLETTQFAFSVETSQHSTDVHSNHSGSGTNNSGTVSMARRKAGIYQPQRVLVGEETRSAEMSRGALYRRSSVAILRKLFPGPTPEKSERGVSTHPGAGAALHDFGLWETVENIPAFSSENECTGKSSGLSPQALPNPSDAVWLKRAASPTIAREGRAARLPSPDGRDLIMGVALLESSDGERTGVRRASIAFDRTSEAVSTNAASSFVASASMEDELQDVKDAGVERWSGRSLNRVGYNLYSDDNAYLSDDRRSASSSDKDINYSDALQTTAAVGRHTTDDTPNTNEGDEVETQRSDGHNGVSVGQGDHDAHHHHHIAATQQAQLVCPHAPQISPRVLSPPVPQATNQPRVHHGTARGLARSSEAGAPSRCRTCRRKGEKLMSEGGRSRAVEETVADIDVSRAKKSIQGRTWQYSTRELDAEGSKLVHLGTAGGMGQLTPSDLWATEEGNHKAECYSMTMSCPSCGQSDGVKTAGAIATGSCSVSREMAHVQSLAAVTPKDYGEPDDHLQYATPQPSTEQQQREGRSRRDKPSHSGGRVFIEGNPRTAKKGDHRFLSRHRHLITWRRGEQIGMGSFGKVFKGMNGSTGELFAVKQIALTDGNPEEFLQLQSEVELMKSLQHRHIVKYCGTERGSRHLYIFLEYVTGGSIASMLHHFGVFKESLVRRFIHQILLGVDYLHDRGIIHRDIKGANILVTDQGIAKLADFGCARRTKGAQAQILDDNLQVVQGSVPWMAPEIIKQTCHGLSADVWSIGATMIEMCTARYPWPPFSNTMAAMYHIAVATEPPAFPEHISDDATNFLSQCLNINHEKRMKVKKLLQHPFVRGAAEELVVTTGQGSEDFEPSLDTGGDELYAFNE